MDPSVDVRAMALKWIERHEGYSRFPIPDAKHTMEIGFGTNLTTRGLSREEADWLAMRDVARLHGWLSSFAFFQRLTDNRKVALIDMAYDLGEDGFAHFGRMLAWLDSGAYGKAADEMLKSRWAIQVPTRALDDAEMMRRG